MSHLIMKTMNLSRHLKAGKNTSGLSSTPQTLTWHLKDERSVSVEMLESEDESDLQTPGKSAVLRRNLDEITFYHTQNRLPLVDFQGTYHISLIERLGGY